MEIAIMAGTPFDTQMGVEIIESQGYIGQAYPISKTPEEQSALQIFHPETLEEIVVHKIQNIKDKGMKNIFVYCNSLSGSVDMDRLGKKFDINIITPLQIYREIGKNYSKIGVIAANNKSTFSIEKIIQEKSPETSVVGMGILPLVNAIESKKKPDDIIKEFDLVNLFHFFKRIDCEAVILGCTHFPYFYNEIKHRVDLPIIDPASKMREKIITG